MNCIFDNWIVEKQYWIKKLYIVDDALFGQVTYEEESKLKIFGVVTKL